MFSKNEKIIIIIGCIIIAMGIFSFYKTTQIAKRDVEKAKAIIIKSMDDNLKEREKRLSLKKNK